MSDTMRGYFGIGVEGISKPMNVGNLMRSAHAFGAEFIFTIAAAYPGKGRGSDTAKTPDHVPFYRYDSAADLALPEACSLVGIELMADATDLPIFPHPLNAAYVLGRERGSLTPELVERCDHIVRIPTRFCINVGVAGAIVMYDRLLSLGRFGDRPLNPRAKPELRSTHVHGEPIIRNRQQP
jgi:tRNA G18 (ribose-2'-O)-methylase SpoU